MGRDVFGAAEVREEPHLTEIAPARRGDDGGQPTDQPQSKERRTPGTWRVEAAALARLGAPIAATQFFIMGMGFMDTVMAGHYASVHLAGVALGSNVLWPVFLMLAGFTMSITPIAAQMVGGGRTAEVGAVLRQGLLLAAVASIPAICIVVYSAPLFALFRIDPAATDIAIRYLRAAAFGLPAGMCYILLRGASEGLGRTVGPMVIASGALALNALLNYTFIYGAFGAPELGGEGCGWATAIVMWFELAAVLVLARFRYFRETGLWQRFTGPDWRHIGHILKVGVPIGLSSFVGMMLFTVIGFLVGSMGVTAIAAHTIAGNINWATFVLPMALGTAAGIRIGFCVGAGDTARAAAIARTAFALSLAYAFVVSGLLVLLRSRVVAIYSDDEQVTALAAALLLLVAIYQVFDDTQGTMAGTLRGYKDTRAPMIYSLLGYWAFALPLGAALGFGLWGLPALGVFGFWLALAGGLAGVAAAMGARLYNTSRDPARIRRLAG